MSLLCDFFAEFSLLKCLQNIMNILQPKNFFVGVSMYTIVDLNSNSEVVVEW